MQSRIHQEQSLSTTKTTSEAQARPKTEARVTHGKLSGEKNPN